MGNITNILLLTLAMTGVFLGLSGFKNELASQYGVNVEQDPQLTVIEETFNQTEAIRSQLQQSSVSSASPVDQFVIITNSAIQAIILLANVPAIFGGALLTMFGLADIFVPGWAFSMITTIVAVIIILGLGALLWKIKA